MSFDNNRKRPSGDQYGNQKKGRAQYQKNDNHRNNKSNKSDQTSLTSHQSLETVDTSQISYDINRLNITHLLFNKQDDVGSHPELEKARDIMKEFCARVDPNFEGAGIVNLFNSDYTDIFNKIAYGDKNKQGSISSKCT